MDTEGYILRTIDYKDTSKLLYVYTETGIQSMIARGVKKMQSPLRHLAQTSNRIMMDLSSGKLPTLKDATLIDHHPSIKQDLVRSTVLSVINELIYYNVSAEDDHPKLFGFLKKFIEVLKTTDHPMELLMVFELKFLFFAGYAVPLRHCHVCKSEEGLAFDVHEGALVCANHKNPNHHYYEAEIYRPLRYYYYVDVLNFEGLSVDKPTLKTLHEAVNHLHSMHMGHTSKAKKILNSLID